MRYRDFAPTALDSTGLALPDRQDWEVFPHGRNRDSDALTRSNWDVITRDISRSYPESNGWEIHRFGHWACGWFEIILFNPSHPVASQFRAWEDSLADYPVADDEAYSNLEFEEAASYWDSLSLRERVEYCREAGISIYAARRLSTLTDCQRIWDRITSN